MVAAAVPPRSADCAPPDNRDILRRLIVVSVPIYPLGLFGRCVGLFSCALVGRLGDTDALAAVGLANVVTNITGYSWLWGLSAAISTLSSQSWGARSYHAVGITLQRAFLILVCFADIPLVVLWLLSEPILLAVDQPPEVARLVALYAQIRIPGIFLQTVYVVVTRTLLSIGNSRIILLVSTVTMISNVAVSFLLIPRYGFIGAPVALLLCDVIQACAVCIFAGRDAAFRTCWSGLSREAWKNWSAFLRISFPSLIMIAVEWWTWDLLSLFAGWISPIAQATQAVVPRFTDIQYSVGEAFGTGATTVIGNLLGEGRAVLAKRSAWLSVVVVFVLMVLQFIVFLMSQEFFVPLLTNDAAIIGNITKMLPLTLVFSFIDGHQCLLSGILVGAGQQSIAAPIVCFCYWVVGLPLGLALAFGALGSKKWGLQGLWGGMLVGVILHAVLLGLVVLRLRWHKIAEEVQTRMVAERKIDVAFETDCCQSLLDGPSTS
eukprot:TRINITY_DN43642_c0_g1_i1.p1 TRINITY_DN43642_c0_g1~~TRINITY_DN43642_c0_g1_i1.p1  ORF type:complete len:524 (-),score=37.49 TRINITY_DN43642_c0_g1_i1:348-1817(-)